jgi:hypothetical protein
MPAISSPYPRDKSAPRPDGPWNRLRRLILLVGIAACAVNVWTGVPLLGLWAGSQVTSAIARVSIGAFVVTLGTIAVGEFILLRVLQYLDVRFAELTGRRALRRRSPWLRSFTDTEHAERRPRLAADERIVVASVIVAFIAFEVWFFFLAGSSLPLGA